MHVDVVDVFRLHACVLQGSLHHELRSEAFGMRCGDMVCVGTLAFANHLGVDFGSASLRVFQFFEDKTSCSFRYDEAVAACAERT